TDTFRAEPGTTSSLVGLVEGLQLGENTLSLFKAKKNGKKHKHPKAEPTLTNRPITGPHFSGPHQQPFICELDAWGLGDPLDENCSALIKVDFFYKSTDTGSFEPLEDPTSAPDDLAQTTTIEGNTVNYIVRLETGTINRAVYQIAILDDDPNTPGPDPWSSEPGWNERLIYTFGGGCNAGFHQGRSTGGVLNDFFLSQGYGVASATLNVLNTNCNDALSAETVMMVKERFIEIYGVPRYTIGWGGSGGAIQQYLIGQNYPGLLDGIIPAASYPDVISTLLGVTDSRLLVNYFNTTTLPWTVAEMAAVSGFVNFATAVVWDLAFASRINAMEACDPAIPPELIYDPLLNPEGVRCTVQDHMVTIFGVDETTGFARRPFDSVGVQYGLGALNDGIISVEQFLDLNEHIGGFDIDGVITSARTKADIEALGIAYETGRVQSGAGGLATIPIIDVRPYLDPFGDIHDRFRTFSTQERLIASNGHADNMVILISNAQHLADAQLEALLKMDEWLANLVREDSDDNVVAAKPAEFVDACWTPLGEKILEPATYDGPGVCNELYPSHGDPRLVAGAPLANDILKCWLKDIDMSDYNVAFTSQKLERLHTIFPDGVCDWSKPGVEQLPLGRTFLSFGPAP
ncbi:MAG: DUF6351 family protein, partial [Planctomycetota bacterium]